MGLGVTVMSLYEIVRFGSVEPFTVRYVRAVLFSSEDSVDVLNGSTCTGTSDADLR